MEECEYRCEKNCEAKNFCVCHVENLLGGCGTQSPEALAKLAWTVLRLEKRVKRLETADVLF
jgi:hypothetical protein